MYQLRKKALADWQAAKTIWKNVLEFMDAVCLMAVSSFAVMQALQHKNEWAYRGLLFAGVAIALQAFMLLVKHFNRPS